MADAPDAPLAALRLLREHLIGGKPVSVEGDDLVFRDASGAELQRLPKHSATAYHSKKLDKSYDLLAVYTCFRHASLSFSDYVLKCREDKAAMVSTVDKKELVSYLSGDSEGSAQILDASGKPTAAPETGKRVDKDRKQVDERAAKKRKVESARHHREKHESHKTPEQVEGEEVIKRITDKEYVNRTRTTVLDAHKTKFDNVIKTLELVNAETKEKIEKASKASTLLATTTARKEQLPLHRLVKEKILGTPIIVVPAGFSDLFTMLNAKDFLEDGVYVSNMQKKKEGHRKQQSMMITHEEDGHVYTFKVVDTVSRFRDKDWRSVVGVIVSGQSWQFKGWKWKFPLEVFKKVCGVHIYNQGSQLGPDIKQWDVKVLMIHPDKRHLDKVAAKEFWRYLFAFIKHKLHRFRVVEPGLRGLICIGVGVGPGIADQALEVTTERVVFLQPRRILVEITIGSVTINRAVCSLYCAVKVIGEGRTYTAAQEAGGHSAKVALRHRKKNHDEQPSVLETTGSEDQIESQNKRAGPQMPALSASSQRGIPVKQIGGVTSSTGGASDSNDGAGPKRALKHAMTLSHFPSNRSLNKVAPEDVVPPPPLTRKQKVLAFVEHRYVSSFMTACTMFALFGDDFRVSFFPKSGDTPTYNVLFALFIFFSIELILNVYSRPNYFNHGRGFSFYLDLISTLSVIPDVDWIWVQVVGSSDTSNASQAAALKAGRASRAGTKAGRIVRLVRLFRMLRILRVVKKNKNGESKKVEISEPSKIGKVLTEKTTRKLIVLVLLIIIISPIIDGTVDLTQDDFQTSQFERLHRYTQDYNKTGGVTMDHMQSLVNEYVRDSNGLVVQMELANIDDDLLKTWLKAVRFQALNSDESDWSFGSNQSLAKNPKTGWSASYLVDDPSEKYRNTELATVNNLGCYVDDVCIDCDAASGTSPCHSIVTYDISSYTKSAANLNIAKTIVVMICFAVSIFVLTRDAESMVIGPIERMMRLVTQLAENPLGSTEAKREEYEEDTPGDTDYETKMLEDTLSKIGRLLQVGFGAAGTEIIAKNMGGAGDLDVMIPGKKITSVFGFGIIEHFTETCSILEEDVITYINTIAEIVHGDAKIFHGAANKNIGSAFLLAWKICDGTLPGMRDPRDPADKPRMLPAEKVRKREGIYVKSAGSGTAVRRVGPTELVDSALTAVLKMRVDIHNANHHGSLHKYCNDTKLIAAFDNFEVHLGFGLHIGWAIEGAIGSKYKIDASYLSPNVNMAARLEAATGQFDVPMLISEWFVDELSAEARRFCRKIDRVAVKGSEIPMDLWTFDIGRYPVEGVKPEISAEGRQKPVEFGFDAIYPALQEGIPSAFFSNFHEGIGAYFAGKWDVARDKLTAANQIWEDGPTKVVLKVMESEGRTDEGEFMAPTWWKGFRQLTEK